MIAAGAVMIFLSDSRAAPVACAVGLVTVLAFGLNRKQYIRIAAISSILVALTITAEEINRSEATVSTEHRTFDFTDRMELWKHQLESARTACGLVTGWNSGNPRAAMAVPEVKARIPTWFRQREC